jgi:hypothetical protein
MKQKMNMKFSTLTLKILFALWFGSHLIKTAQNKKYQINKVYYYVVVVYHYLIYPFLFFYLFGMFLEKGLSVLMSFLVTFLVLFFVDILLAFIAPIKEVSEGKNS